MRGSFKTLVGDLKVISRRFGAEDLKRKTALIQELHTRSMPSDVILQDYQDILLYCSVYPHNKSFHRLVSSELTRLARKMRMAPALQSRLTNTGLPFTNTTSSFSIDLVHWMHSRNDYGIALDSFAEEGTPLADVLRLTLPDAEKHMASGEENNHDLLRTLGIPRDQHLQFLLSQIASLESPEIRDYLYDALQVYVSITPRNKAFSKAFNRLEAAPVHCHDELLKRFAYRSLIDSAIPPAVTLDKKQTSELIAVIRHDLALLQRETDPSTYLDDRSLRYYHLERGVSIALYTMTATRQLPLESYVGYTLFKNGYPVAYGGAWVFGKYALFGINIHDAFRGGESGYLLCQLLRTYRQLFSIGYFEVEPYQYGKDNPEGISTGAYWFYYHYGFRSLDEGLFKLAEQEHRRILKDPKYRSPKSTLKKFTQSNSALQLGRKTPPAVYDFLQKITALINSKYHGDRNLAVQESTRKFLHKLKTPDIYNADEQKVLTDMALLHEALQIRSPKKRALMEVMIRLKPTDLYGYQECLKKFLC